MITKNPKPAPYSLIPTAEPPSQPPRYVILQYYPYHHNYPSLRRVLLFTFSLLALSLLLYLTFPSDPELQLTRVKLNHIRIHIHPFAPSVSLSLSVTLRVRNRNLFSLSYRSLDVAVSYRGHTLGFVSSHGNEIKAKESSYVDATLVVDGFEVLRDLFSMIDDIASGSVPFDTVSTVSGHVGIFFVQIPIQGKVSCEVDVNPKNQKIVHQNCYPDLLEAESPSPT